MSRSTGVVKTNQHTLTCTGTTKVLLDHRNDLPRLSFNFESLSAVDVKEKNDVMDVIGICHSIGPAVNVTLTNSEEGLKRELKLIDQSDKEVIFDMLVRLFGLTTYLPISGDGDNLGNQCRKFRTNLYTGLCYRVQAC